MDVSVGPASVADDEVLVLSVLEGFREVKKVVGSVPDDPMPVERETGPAGVECETGALAEIDGTE